MGRSNSCFKIITCGSDSADNDDLDVSESKGPNDKRGWSFRKKSARHRVLSNSVVTETPSSVEKESLETADVSFQTPSSVKEESLELADVNFQTPPSAKKESLVSANVNFQPPNISNVPEKIPTIQCIDEKPQLPTPVETKTSETIIETDADDSPLDESVVTVIQAAVRGILAQRELLKLKNVVKLQAAVRGHLVRRHAVGTLRCVQAIVKMQTLVRARHARLDKEPDWKAEKDTCNSVTSKGNLLTKPNATRTSIQNLLSNRFARQLMESTPKNKPIHIKCDPAKQDSAWNWLERWMSVSSAKQTVEPGSKIGHSENEKNENFASPVETNIPSEVLCDSADSKSSLRETDVLSKTEENLITHDDKFNFQQSWPTSLGDDLELSQPEKNSTSDVTKVSIEIDSHQSQIMQSDASSQQELKSLSNMPEMESEPPKRSMKRFASEDLETEGKKFVFGSRKASNPAFIAAHSKFEELSSSANSGKSISSQQQDVSLGSNAGNISAGADTLTRTTDLSIGENSVSRIQYGGSECGTELSISSTLDSPDRSEVGNTEYEHSTKVSENEICDPKSLNNLDVKASDASSIPTCDVSHSIVNQPEKVDDVRNESVDSLVVIDAPVQPKPDNSPSDFRKEPDSETGHQAYRPYRSSPEASPRSHITVPESQGTPASQVSVKAKNNRSDKRGSYRKRKPLSASKGSPSKPNHDSGARSSTERLPKDQKNGKSRSSFGSSRTDNIDQEPGENSSSSSLPHFMQATESARAKIQANNSPRSSPDVQDRDIYIKKRHSLPVANGRHGSPRIQRSLSQAQQGAKGNGTLHEKKWQR